MSPTGLCIGLPPDDDPARSWRKVFTSIGCIAGNAITAIIFNGANFDLAILTRLPFRRANVEDMAEAHVVALEIGFDHFIVSAPTPFARTDCAALIEDAPAVVARLFPDYPALYARRGWTMFRSIDRVYDPGKAARKLGFACRTGFREVLDGLAAEELPRPLGERY